jgi:hypothetical protein
MPPWYPIVVIWSEPTSKLPYHKLQYPTYVKEIDLDAHIRVNGEIVEVDIIILFGFTLWDNIPEWGKNSIQDPNCTFEELEQVSCKHFRTVKNDEKVYM